ncbi:MAG: HPr family phosphocarrier protein [Candidatus Izemoplasmatales bacterium]|jgi:phosphocarrier protein HPr
MIEYKYRIIYRNGLHARPATTLVSKANSFASEIVIEYDYRRVNLKSIMGVLSLGIPCNKSFKIIFKGPDEEEAFKAISKVLADINALP